LAIGLSTVVAVGATPTPAHAQADCDEIRAEPDPNCQPEPPPPPPPSGPLPCLLFPDNPYGPYCGILGTFFDPNSPCSPFYCGGPFIIPIVSPALVDPPALTANLIEAIRVRENLPNQVTESQLNTVAGLPASLATVEQATIGYTLSALKNHLSLRAFAVSGQPLLEFPIYLPDIEQGITRATNTRTLLIAVEGAVNIGQTVESFLLNNALLVSSTGLSADNVRTMFQAVPLKARIDAAHARVQSGASTLAQEVAAIPEADRLGLGAGSLQSYIRNPLLWGENRAAWERQAVRTLPNNLGYKFEARATYADGRTLAREVYKSRVQQAFAQAGCTGEGNLCLNGQEADVVRSVGQSNNPGLPGYGQEVLTIYCRMVYGTTC
jgi:hypothetical protein